MELSGWHGQNEHTEPGSSQTSVVAGESRRVVQECARQQGRKTGFARIEAISPSPGDGELRGEGDNRTPVRRSPQLNTSEAGRRSGRFMTLSIIESSGIAL